MSQMQKLESGLINLKRNKMETYLDFLAVTLMTATTLGVVIIIVAGGYMIYKYIKDEY